jgi:hypothetical protein
MATNTNRSKPGTRRAVEVEYLRDALDILTRDRWRAIVTKAAEMAEQGDDKARAWLTRLALSEAPPTPSDVALRDVAGVTADDEIAAAVAEAAKTDLQRLVTADNDPPLTVAVRARMNG